MLDWTRINWSMKMSENSRAMDKKPLVNNNRMYGGASARVETYKNDIEDEIPILRSKFDTLRMVVL